jgi:hypothetical protein
MAADMNLNLTTVSLVGADANSPVSSEDGYAGLDGYLRALKLSHGRNRADSDVVM